MRSYPIHQARADLSKLLDRALAGEPQRVTRRGREAVVIVSEEAWRTRQRPLDAAENAPEWQPRDHYNNLGELLVDFAEQVGFQEEDFVRPGKSERPLGSDFVD